MRPLIRLAMCLLAAACGVPRDADGALDRARGGVLRVGVTDRPPWDSVSGTTVSGIEPALIADLARSIGATPTWRRGAESELLGALERRELDVVAAGLTTDSPWATRVALTVPYRTDQHGDGHVLALSPGENALLVQVERFLHERGSTADTVPTR